jgi:hypothetical protein
METLMHINKIGLVAVGLLLGNMALAQENSTHGILSKEETAQGAKEGKLCVLNDLGNSLGAVVKKDGRFYRCVKAYGTNLEPKTELVWVELAVKDKALETLP